MTMDVIILIYGPCIDVLCESFLRLLSSGITDHDLTTAALVRVRVRQCDPPLAPRLDRVLPLVSFEVLGPNLDPLFPPVTFPFPPAALCEASLAITFDIDIRGFLPDNDR